MTRVFAEVSGRVQGVGYRFFAADEASLRNIVGYSMNLPDGRVEVVAEGPRDVLEDFLAALGRGPDSGHVDSVSSSWRGPTGEFEGFTIRY
ncbi:MAG: acylphosphatase [Candidatus Eisenbacteria sp.]|nr:acylphosphatase [Candidatus Eisenbacteria bacterium]